MILLKTVLTTADGKINKIVDRRKMMSNQPSFPSFGLLFILLFAMMILMYGCMSGGFAEMRQEEIARHEAAEKAATGIGPPRGMR